MRWFLSLTAVASAAVFVTSYGGALHPAFDSLTVLRVPAALWTIFGLLFARLRKRAIYGCIALAAALFLGWHSLAWNAFVSPEGSVTVYHHNVLFSNKRPEEVLRAIARHDPDVITLVEVSASNRFILDDLASRYPHGVHCAHEKYGAAILSRLPPGPDDAVCVPKTNGIAAAALSVDGPAGASWIATAHLHWPWPFSQRESAESLWQALSAMAGPKIVTGDFNAMPWSHAVRGTIRHANATYIGPRRKTFRRYRVPLPLDHVLAGSGQVEVLDRFRSDHRALLAHVDFTSAE